MLRLIWLLIQGILRFVGFLVALFVFMSMFRGASGPLAQLLFIAGVAAIGFVAVFVGW